MKKIITSSILTLGIIFIAGCGQQQVSQIQQTKKINTDQPNEAAINGQQTQLTNSNIIVNQKQSDLAHKISPSDLATVKNLFIKNNLNVNDLQISSFEVRETLADNPLAGYYSVHFNRIYNKLPIFLGGDGMYQFNKDGIKVNQSGNVSNVDIEISQDPKISKEDAATILLKKYPDKFNKQNLFAELGIANKKVGMGYKNPNLVLLWKITIGSSKYPYAFINATNGEIIYFDDGVRDF